jgi:O-antigen/teichoic acid export membrane protein
LTLKHKTFSAIRWTTLAMVGRAVLQFLQIAILARLLSPTDFGLMALVMAVVVFAHIFTDMGVSNAIIHHQQLSQEELSSLYWLNVASGAVMMLLVMLVSPFIADFYNAPALRPLLLMVGSFFLISAFGQQLRVIAEKELRFSALAKIELISALAGFTVAVLWAWQAPSVLALIAGLMTGAIVMTVLCWLMLANGWRPMWRLKPGEIGQFLRFGGYTMANNLVNTFNLQADVFIGGRFLTASSLGVYSLPRSLSLRVIDVVNPIITRVGLPVMAKAQHDQPFLKRVYLKTLRMTASVNFPIYMAILAFAPEMVTVLFGDQWQDAIPILRILALWGLIRSVGNPVGSLIFAVGRADLAFKWNLASAFVVLPMVWVGVHFGNQGLAVSLVFASMGLVLPGWYVLVRPLCGATFMEYFRQLAIPLSVAMVAASVAYIAAWALDDALLRLGMGLVTGAMAYIALSRWLNRMWFEAMWELITRKKMRT